MSAEETDLPPGGQFTKCSGCASLMIRAALLDGLCSDCIFEKDRAEHRAYLAAPSSLAEIAARDTILKETTEKCVAAGFTSDQISGVCGLVRQALKSKTKRETK